ncbi:MAG TPA: cupin domain-containing protein [Caulobacteraceae bacterium]
MDIINLDDKFAQFNERWRPKIVAQLNGQEVKLVKVQGVFPWHCHEDADEMFLVWRGSMRVEFRDHAAELDQGEFVVVPRGVEHRTAAEQEAEVLIFERADVLNTGNVSDPVFTAPLVSGSRFLRRLEHPLSLIRQLLGTSVRPGHRTEAP